MTSPDFDLLARYYDLEVGEFAEDISLYLGFASRAGSPVLELGCGTGRVLLALADAGFDVVGVDVSREMLARAADKVASHPAARGRVRLMHADARELDLAERFGMAFWAINSFMHLPSRDDQMRALRRAHALLRGGGLFVLDLFNPAGELLADADGRLVHDATWRSPTGDGLIVKSSSRRVDEAAQRVDVTYFYDEVSPAGDCRRVVAPFDMRYLHRYEAELLLEAAGLPVEAVYGSYELDPFASGSERLILVARKGST